MGTWGPGPFENDAAADWLARLEDEPALDTLTDALRAAADASPVPADAAAEAVAAAEVVAELRGGTTGAPSASLGRALRNAVATDVELPRLAVTALERVLRDSDFASLWRETDGDEWRDQIERLKTALATPELHAQDRTPPTSPTSITYTCSRRGHTKRLSDQTAAGLNVAAWHAATAAQGQRDRLVGVRAELRDLVDRHSDPECPLRAAGVAMLPEIEAAIADETRPLDAMVSELAALQERVVS